MPQMSPLNWLSLMLTFVSILVLFNIVNYYSFNYNFFSKKLDSKKQLSSVNWKW